MPQGACNTLSDESGLSPETKRQPEKWAGQSMEKFWELHICRCIGVLGVTHIYNILFSLYFFLQIWLHFSFSKV